MTWRSGWSVTSSVALIGWFLAGSAALILSLSACGNDTDFELHAPMWGYVIGPDGPLSARVQAYSPSASAYAETDANGRYELPLGAGAYRISAEVEGFGRVFLRSDRQFGFPDAETEPGEVEITPLMNPLRIDVQLSSAQITIGGLEPWEGREIEAEFSRQEAVATVSGGAATLMFPLVAAGDHFLEVEEAYVPGTHFRHFAKRFEVGSSDRAVIETAMTNQPTFIHGTLVDPNRFGTWIQCVVPGDRRPLVETDSTGRFSAALWAARATFEIAYGEFGLSERADGVADTFALVPGETLELPRFTLPGITIAPEGGGEFGARFWVRDEKGRVWREYGPPYVLGPLPVGRYLVGADHGLRCELGWIPTRCESPDTCDALPIEVVVDVPSTLVPFQLRAGARIEGRIVGAPSGTLAQMRLVGDGWEACSGGWHLAEHFTLNGLRTGSYRLEIEVDDRVLWFPGVESENAAEIIEISDDEELIWLDVVWPDPL